MKVNLTRIFQVSLLTTLVLTAVVVTKPISAQEDPNQAAKKYGISFPIAELGSCISFQECKNFCDDPANKDQCVSFAKKKGFYKEPPREGRDQKLISAASKELGCSSEETCRAVCEKEENIDKCSSFAEKHGLGGGQRGNPGDRRILQKAKDILGCNSEASCKAVCENPANQQKCSDFAAQTGLGGGVRRVGPGGCTSEETCQAFCQNNPDECRKFGGGPPGSADANRRGPGGCNSEESCRAYCEKNPNECDGNRGPGGPNGQGGPANMEEFCKLNPDKCSGRQGGPQNISPDEFCKQNPDKCGPPSGSSPPNYGSTGSQGSYTPSGYQSQPNQTQYQGQYQPTGGTQTTPGSTTQYDQGSTPSPTNQVQSARTEKNFFQKFWSWLGF